MADFEYAKDKVLMGSERRSMIITEDEKRITAIHEAGHALLAAHPAARRSGSQGDDHPARHGARRHACSCRWTTSTTTRATTCRISWRSCSAAASPRRSPTASSRPAPATTSSASRTLARKMVCEWGMSEAMGPLTFGKHEEQIFLGREISKAQDYSEDTAIRIDQEVKKFVMDQYDRARIDPHASRSRSSCRIADELLAREVLDADQVRRLAQGLPLEDPSPAPRAAADRRDAAPRNARTAVRADARQGHHAGVVETSNFELRTENFTTGGRAFARLLSFEMMSPKATSCVRSSTFDVRSCAAVRPGAPPRRPHARDGRSSTSRPTRSPTAASASIRTSRSPTRSGWWPTAQTCSTSAASRRARAPRRCRSTKNFGA